MVPINTLLRTQKSDDQILKPVIPGVNLPKKDLGYYLVTIFISALVHEFGHAVAAVRESVRINGFGMFVFVIYPGAFVDMHSETLFAVSAWKQLKIFCAGVWHNLVVVLIGALMLYSLPTTLRPFYTLNENLVIVSHTENSVVSGESGLIPGDIVTQINDCKVSSILSWRNCLTLALDSDTMMSYAVPQSVMDVQSHPTSLTEKDCVCGDTDNHICFQRNPLAVSPPNSKENLICLKAREVIIYSPCKELSPSTVCVAPYIGHLNNKTRLLVLYRTKKPPVLFFGHPAELHLSVIIGEVVPRFSWIPLFLPYTLENLFKYFISLSGALALLNIVPCYALDGQYIAKAVTDIVFKNFTADQREIILTLSVLCGTLLLVVNVALAMYNLLL
ncbi:MBTPS2 [Bugula neritina]|uniref:Membrane-bound transcription factor site-2 protease n=1 Tax=Bugula neritina TaxID=10212 RepID=A0A7J7J9M9_BUGNE|nr:MBTPS2 [Bugula neritina]